MTDRFAIRATRRKAMLGTASLAGTALAQPFVSRLALGQSKFDWRRFAGTTLNVMMPKSTRSDLAQGAEKEFEALTGIKVSSEAIPEQQQRQKVLIEFTSGKPSFDVTKISLHVQKRIAAKGRWFEDVRPLIADASVTNPDFDFGDFGAAGRNFSTQSDSLMDTMPNFVDYCILYYNKELFQQKGVAYPKTMDEIATAAAKLNDPANGIAGFVSRGLKNANVPVWTSWLLGQGIETISASGELQTSGPEAIWAAELYKRLNKDYAPPGTIGFNWNECQTSFATGRAAMWLDGIGFAAPLEDPSKSRVVGKVGYGVVPPGPKAQHSAIFGDGFGIVRGSPKKQAAWLYVQFMVNKTEQLKMLKSGAGAPARNSPFADTETIRQSKFGKEWFDCILASAKIGRPGLPVIVPVTEFRDIFGVALTNMIGGADPKTELAKATEQFKPILEKSEKT